MKLEIGCGHRPTPGYLRVDADPNIPADWHGDASTTMPWDDETFDEIVAQDVLEHIPYRRTVLALTEWRRLLVPGGRLYLQVPDCGRIMREYVDRPARWRERLPADLEGLPPIIGVAWRVLGGQDDGAFSKDGDDWRLNGHYAMFDEPALRWYLRAAGLSVESIESNPHPNLLCWAYRPKA